MRATYPLCAALMAANSLFADHRKLSHDLRGLNPDTTVDVIVQFKSVPAALHHDKLARGGARLKADLHSINADVYTLRAGALESLADDPEVEHIALDRSLSGTTRTGGWLKIPN